MYCNLKCDVKVKKTWAPIIIDVIILQTKPFFFISTIMHPPNVDEMTNSVDPDQTAPEGAV